MEPRGFPPLELRQLRDGEHHLQGRGRALPSAPEAEELGREPLARDDVGHVLVDVDGAGLRAGGYREIRGDTWGDTGEMGRRMRAGWRGRTGWREARVSAGRDGAREAM